MKLDLHVHSTASDGTCPPDEVVARAIQGGLDVLALADHDTIGGVQEALDAAAGRRLQVVPAIELSSTLDGMEIHILGYFIDIGSQALAEHELRSRRRRGERMREMVDRLALQGVRIQSGQLDAQRHSDEVALARPHLARAIVEAGYAASVPDAFARLIGDDCPAYVATDVATPAEVIAVVLGAGGIPVWAHPPPHVFRDLLPAFVDAGLRGVEVYRPNNRARRVAALIEGAREAGLLVTGGSDWHGPEAGRELGEFHVTAEEIADFLAAGGM